MPNTQPLLRNRISTIDWLCYHYDKTTGEPFLSDANQYAAEKFSILCEKMIANYRLSNWQSYVDKGHINSEINLNGNARQALHKALKTLGDDAAFTADIVLKNYSLPMAEKKHKISRGKAKVKLRQVLDRLADSFGIKQMYRKDYAAFD